MKGENSAIVHQSGSSQTGARIMPPLRMLNRPSTTKRHLNIPFEEATNYQEDAISMH